MKILRQRGSIYYRILIVFLSLGIIPCFLMGVISFMQSREAVYSKVNKYSTEIMKDLAVNIGREMNNLENISIDIAYSDNVQSVFKDYTKLTASDVRQQQISTRMSIAKKVTLLNDLTDVIAYTLNGDKVILYGDSGYKFTLKKEYEKDFLDKVFAANSKTVYSSFSAEHQIEGLRLNMDMKVNNDTCILLGRAVRSLDEGEVIGALVVRMSQRQLSNILNNVDVGENAQILVIDSDGRIISTTSEYYKIGNIVDSELAEKAFHPHKKAEWVDNKSGTRSLLTSTNIEGCNWSGLCLIPDTYLNNEIYIIYKSTLIVLALLILIIAYMAKVFSQNLSKPLAELATAMHQVENGTLDIFVESERDDEIGTVTRGFNNMLERIKVLLQNVKAQERAKRKAELSALQAQINPHFLSNTLNTAKILAHTQKADNIENLLVSLIELLHISISSDNTFITLQEEIEYAKNYVDIMRYRSFDNFDIVYDIEPGTEAYMTPKLILQPLVENAVIHGIEKMGGAGQIVVRTRFVGENIHITVTDNGEGIEPELLDKILDKTQVRDKARFSGIGLVNVNERIKMHFGEDYGLFIESIYHVYTTVGIILPITKGEMSDDKRSDS